VKLRFAALAMVFVLAPWALAQEHWVATWAASPQQGRGGAPQAGRGALPGAPAPITGFHNQTVRMILRTSIAGSRVRLQFSNLFGTAPLTVGTAHIALQEKESSIVAGSDRALTFNGKPSVTIFPGSAVLSDPVDLNVPETGDLAISVYIPGDTLPQTTHATGLHTTYVSKEGDFTAAPSISEPMTTSRSWYWISDVEVLAPADSFAIATFGDSITDGATSTVDADASWPAFLAKRLAANAATAKLAVLNEGISGNRLLRENAGPSALARFDRDVLALPGVKWVTIMEGINDIGRGTGANATGEDSVTPDDLIGALKQLIERAHAHGINVLGCTLTPYEGAAYYSETGEVMRQAVNRWIRTSGAFDAVVDFEAVVRDPNSPKQIRADYNIRDHLHPNDAGYKAMADAIDLGVFTAKASAARAGSR
jgi:lysophospholipase L1-like esterase